MGRQFQWYLFLLVSFADSNSFLFPKNIDIQPVDQYVFVGEQINMTCTLAAIAIQNGNNSSAINFSYGNDRAIPEEETYIINSTTKGFTLKIDSVFDHVTYGCYFGPLSACHLENMDCTSVEAEYPPQPVQNFRCIIYDWDEKMECSWGLGVAYKNLKNINTSLELRESGGCPNMQLLNCTWFKSSDDKSFDRRLLSFQINVTNTKRQVVSSSQDWIEIEQNDYVKPSRISSLTINVTSRCVELEWKHPMVHRFKLFIIGLTSKWGDNQVNETANFRTLFCNLTPSTEYEVTIVTRPGENKGYPSDPYVNTFTTEIELPDAQPEIDIGNFYISSDLCSVLDQRNVTVYWKELAEIDKNGPDVEYCLKVQEGETITTGQTYRSLTIPCTQDAYRSLTLPCTQDVTVSIWSQNRHGPSKAAVEFVISKADVIPMPRHIIVEAVNTSPYTTVTVSWTPADDPRVTSYTVYYCQYDTECVNNIDWKTVPSTSHTLTLTQFMFDKKNRFGVSANTDMYSSGFKWQQCYYLKSEAPSAPNVIDVQAYPNDAITVDWSEPECGRSPYIMFYIVKWCIVSEAEQSCNGITGQVNISSTLPPKYVIHNLKAGTTYGVQVAYSTADGRVAYSEVIKTEPTNNDLADSEIAGISIAAIFVLCLSIASVIFCYRRICYRIKDFQKPFDIMPIPIDTNKSLEYISRQISIDSGRGSVTSVGLQSPSMNIGYELKADPEELNPNIDKLETELDSDYSKITNQNENSVANPDLKKTSVQSKSPSNNTISSYKLGSEEMLIVKPELCDQDGYVTDPMSKSLQALEEHPDESALASYVRQDFDQSYTRETFEEKPYINPDLLPLITDPPLLDAEDKGGSCISRYIEQGPDLHQGSYVKQGSDLDQGSYVKQGHELDHGSCVKQRPDLDQGSNVKKGPHFDQGSNVKQGPNLVQGSYVKQGPDLDQGSYVKQGPDLEQGSYVKQGHDLDQASYVRQGLDFDQSFTSETFEGKPYIIPDVLPTVQDPPLLDTEDQDGSFLSIISDKCLDNGAINGLCIFESTRQGNYVLTDGYRRLDSIENPTFPQTLHGSKPLMCINGTCGSNTFNSEESFNSNQSLCSESQNVKDYLPEEVAKNLID